MKIEEKAIEILKDVVCNECLGRQFSELLSGYSNEERGKIVRTFVAFLLDSDEKINVDIRNFYCYKFRNLKIKPEKPERCKLCKNFFREKIELITKEIFKKAKNYEAKSFLIGVIPSDEMKKEEEKLWMRSGIEFVEPIKSEISRELGKKIEKNSELEFNQKNPDLTILVDLEKNKVRIDVRSLYVFGKYQKLARGIPQTKWICSNCGGKGCVACKGTGKLYKTSVQEIIEKPFLTTTRAKESSFHGAGREDIDARNLDYRPFVIELINPKKRTIDLKKIQNKINKSRKVKAKNLRIVEKDLIEKIKSERLDKSYLAEVEFEKNIDKQKIKELKKLEKATIIQKTPTRVVHRRADIIRKRGVKKISWELKGKKKLEIKIKTEAGLYIKELITGDEGRTNPNVADLISNKVKKISLDVIKIHTKGI
jgi:tRNA pseudouridine synthase 10